MSLHNSNELVGLGGEGEGAEGHCLSFRALMSDCDTNNNEGYEKYDIVAVLL